MPNIVSNTLIQQGGTAREIIRGACYERVSTEEQVKFGFSVDAQIADLNEYCEENNIKIVDHYTEKGVSAGMPPHKRPQLARLLQDVKDGKIDVILFTKLDRWTRSTKYYYRVQEVLDAYKVSWKAIQEDYETETSSGKFKVNIMLAVAEAEREKTSERIKAVFDNKRKNKECFLTAINIPFGYTKELDANGTPRMVKDPDVKDAVQDFWDIAVKYDSLSKAMKYCNQIYGLHRSERSWLNMAHNDVYTGVYKGVEGYCEPYVSVEDWEKLHDRKIKKTQHNRVYLFSGLMRCPTCGQKLVSSFSHVTSASGERKEYRSYRCRKNRLSLCDTGYSIAESTIERYLVKNIYKLLEGEIARVELEQAKPKRKPKNNAQSLKEQLRRLNVSYRMGNMPDDEYIEESLQLKAQIDKAEAELQNESAEKDLTPLKKLLETDFRNIYKELSLEDKQRLWRSIVNEIHLDENGIKSVDFLYPNIMD